MLPHPSSASRNFMQFATPAFLSCFFFYKMHILNLTLIFTSYGTAFVNYAQALLCTAIFMFLLYL